MNTRTLPQPFPLIFGCLPPMCVRLSLVKLALFVRGTMSLTCNVGHQSDCGGVGLVGTMATEECQASVQDVQCMVHTFASVESTGVCQTKVGRCTAYTCAYTEQLISLLSNQSDTDMSDFQCTVCSTDFCNEEDVEWFSASIVSGCAMSGLSPLCALLGLISCQLQFKRHDAMRANRFPFFLDSATLRTQHIVE